MKYPWHVYRLFDSDGQCLYVGACADLVRRIGTHRRRSWGDSIDQAVITFRATKAAAHALEHEERDRLKPIHCLEPGFGNNLGRGQLSGLIVDVLRDGGPADHAEVARRLRIHGWEGATGSVGQPIRRLLDDGVIIVVGERPASKPGRHKVARIFGLVEHVTEAAA